ncbi:MAG TPA: hypothetical protein PKE15_15155, partial [Ottowia sp.]|nr:hypothetical protein [Ottowia sp.]
MQFGHGGESSRKKSRWRPSDKRRQLLNKELSKTLLHRQPRTQPKESEGRGAGRASDRRGRGFPGH